VAKSAEKPSIIFGQALSGKPAPMTDSEEAAPAVLDTNVVLDWLVFRDARMAQLAQAIETGRVRWLGTSRMRDELVHVLGRSLFDHWVHQPQQVLTFMDELMHPCPEPPTCSLICRDKDDQLFIDLALAQRTTWLFTRDKALLRLARLARPHGTTICPPSGWT
jgi:putative PIN family toxin of toxin-antitoxin system